MLQCAVRDINNNNNAGACDGLAIRCLTVVCEVLGSHLTVCVMCCESHCDIRSSNNPPPSETEPPYATKPRSKWIAFVLLWRSWKVKTDRQFSVHFTYTTPYKKPCTACRPYFTLMNTVNTIPSTYAAYISFPSRRLMTRKITVYNIFSVQAL